MVAPRCSSHHASGFTTVLVLVLSAAAAPGGAQPPASALDCSRTCVCASNIVSCSRSNLTAVPGALPPYTAVLDLSFNAIARLRAEWTPVRLARLRTLLLANNGLHFLSSEAFAHVTGLRYLDLSSNRIGRLDELMFEPLERLEVLLLYDNAISQIDRTAFSGLAALQKLYLSHNLISRFPLELVKERGRLETLRLLDVSSNRIKALPLSELQALPAWIQDGLYFHGNAPSCSCQLYELVARWRLKRLSSVSDFGRSHRCVLPGPSKDTAPVLDLDRIHLNCSAVSAPDKEAFLDQFLVLDCDARQRHVKKTWFLPGNVPLSSGNRSAVLHDGNLQIGPLRTEDSGVYTCVAAGDSFNETLYVSVVVFNATGGGGLENLKTAYTTLVACLVSVVMVLVYLYFTPCRCACCPGNGLEKSEGRGSLRSSTVSVSQNQEEEEGAGPGRGGEGGGFAYRHVGVLEVKEPPEPNGRLNPIGEEDEDWPDGRERRRSDAESVSSVCSDTPMVV